MSRHKKHPSFFSSAPSLPARIDRAVAEGRFQQALELARQLHKQEPTPQHLDLLKRVSLGRARQLHEQKYDRDALTMLDAALRIDPLNPAWLAQIAELMGLCGGVKQSLALLDTLPEGTERQQILARAADSAIQQQAAGRAGLPPALHGDFDRILQASREIEAGQDEQAKTTLQGIGLRSPFLEWKVFLRGLQAYYQQDDARALENWQRLETDRVPARLAAPLRFQIDPAYQAAQPPATQALLRKKTEQLSANVLLTQLRHLRTTMADKQSLPAAFRQLDSLLPLLREQAPHLVPRLANYFYWAILHTGPEDVARYRRVFGTPADDPQFNRLEALAYERGADLKHAHESWLKYEKDLAELSRSWPAEEAQRARALVWLHAGKNAGLIPSRKKRGRMPAFLRGPLGFLAPLKPPAEKCFRESLKLAPDLLEAHEALFLHEMDEERPAQAVKAGQALLKCFPEHVPTLERLAGLLQHQGKPDEGLALLQRALKNNPLNRQLREKISAAHVYSARTAVERSQFDQAREHYRLAIEMDADNRVLSLCKWAACEFKAGDAVRAEELIQQARTRSASQVVISYQMLIEVLRMGLERDLKTRFEKEFKVGLAQRPTAADVVALLELTMGHHAAQTNYTGQKAHAKQVLSYTEKARKQVSFSEKELAVVCEILVALEGGVRSVQGYLEKAQRVHHNNPHFPYLEASFLMDSKKRIFNVFRVRHLLGEAERLARAMPEGAEKAALQEKITARSQAMGGLDPFGGFPMPDFFDAFEDEDFDDDFDE